MIETKNENELLTRKQAAAYLRVCLTTLDRLSIPHIKIRRGVRYRMSDIQRWLDEHSEGGKA